MTLRATKPKASLYFELGVPLAFFMGVLVFLPLGRIFQIDFDEGINLMKAVLYAQGFPLYTQVWSDQPPLYTVLLSHWLHVFGHSIFAMRLLTLIFATVLVGAFSQIIRKFLGIRIAIVSVIFLSASFGFLIMSSSVMIGLPSMTLAVLSIYLLLQNDKKPRLLLITLSGASFAISLQIKLFTILLAPLILIQLILEGQSRVSRHRFRNSVHLVLWWLSSCFLVFIGIGLFLKTINFDQLLQTHFSQDVRQGFPEEKSYLDVVGMLLLDLDYLLLAIPGAAYLLKQKRWQSLFPLMWFVTAVVALALHTPIWWHHQILLSLPLIWLAAYGLKVALDFLSQPGWRSQCSWANFRRPTASLLAIVFLFLSIAAFPIKLLYLQVLVQSGLQKTSAQLEMVENLQAYQESTHWLFTDLPIYGFYTNLNVPPEIAVFSGKRLKSGNLTIETLQAVLDFYQPEQILLGRFPEVRTQLSDYITAHYSQVHEQDGVVHYVSNRLR